jgi:DtxR family transcriptional regulator, Mn-dependent transcriptional regulator
MYTSAVVPPMETLEQLTRRQVDALRLVAAKGAGERGLGLSALAEALGVRPPSALEHLGALEGLGLIERYRGKSRATRRGLACLEEYLRHHRVAESLFARAGLGADATHAAALEVDLALSHHTVQRICEGEGHPEVCPHGEPIAPCAPASRPTARRVRENPVGARAPRPSARVGGPAPVHPPARGE